MDAFVFQAEDGIRDVAVTGVQSVLFRSKFTAIVVPSTLPYLVVGMKVGFGLALKVSVVAEIFGVTSGIGYVMNYSREILATRSEERRVGKECRSRWSPYH